ncbi:MAG: DUF5317 domain-containing protein [Bellilinea sp.]|jgi:hypothetical protein
MFLLIAAVIAGLIFGLIRAKLNHRTYQPYRLQYAWLVLAALILQWLAFTFPPTRSVLPDEIASVSLVLSQSILLVFAWFNRKTPGFWLLGAGLILNLVVISLNGGFMPISPETVRWLFPDAPEGAWQIGERLGYGRDVVLAVEQTKLQFLSDHFRTPDNPHYRVAFSAGDVLIAAGAFWLLWSVGSAASESEKEKLR